jgi:hypothetical protein
MKLTQPQAIEKSEKALMDTINAAIDWKTIEQLLKEKSLIFPETRVDYKGGDLVVHDNQIAYKLDFEIRVPWSVLFNREGECLDIASFAADPSRKTQENRPSGEMADLKERSSEKVEQLAASIADMINEINSNSEVDDKKTR